MSPGRSLTLIGYRSRGLWGGEKEETPVSCPPTGEIPSKRIPALQPYIGMKVKQPPVKAGLDACGPPKRGALSTHARSTRTKNVGGRPLASRPYALPSFALVYAVTVWGSNPEEKPKGIVALA